MGNICRSPLLEGWARKVIAEAGRSAELRVDSAGTGDWHAGQPPDRRAIAAAARQGLDIGGQRARAVTAADFQHFDWLLCADRDNLQWLRAKAPADRRDRIALVLDWCGVEAGAQVPDPYYGDDRDFDAVCRLARSAAEGLLRQLPPQA